MDPVQNEALPVADAAAPVEDVVQTTDSAERAAPTPEVAEAVAAVTSTADAAGRQYPSLYDSTSTTIIAIFLGAAIVGAIQVLVVRMYTGAKSEHIYLTRFVTSLVALIVGCYIADLLIAGPDTSLLTSDEKTLILTFVKDTALMIFSYYFGLKAQAPKDDGGSDE
jgi:hypothetical protein